MDQAFLQDLHDLLVQCTGNDTNELKAATARLNAKYYKVPEVITALANILGSDATQAVRQLAAVEMRKRVSQKNGDLWKRLTLPDRQVIKDKLPHLISAEEDHLVRHSAARVVAAIFSVETSEAWPELIPLLIRACESPVETECEVGVYMLFTILDISVEPFEDQLSSLLVLLSELIVNRENIQVRITTVRALGYVAQCVNKDDKHDVKLLQSLIPSIIKVVELTLEEAKRKTGKKWVDEAARQLFDVFETLLILEVPLLSPHITPFVAFLLHYGSDKELESDLRVLVLNALSWTVQYKKYRIQSQSLAGVILKGLMPITTEPEAEDSEDDTPSRCALRVLDALATNLPPTQVFPGLAGLVHSYLSSPDPNFRRGAMLALGVVVEGCSEFMMPHMNEVWGIIELCLRDSDNSVKKATCVALSCLCEWCEDECAAKHATLIPAILDLVVIPETQQSACTALDALLEIMQGVIDQHLDTIMGTLARLLDTAPISVKAVVTGAIGSAAHASKSKFLPYFQPTMSHLQQYFSVMKGKDKDKEDELRGIAMDAVGTIAEAVGKEVFRPYFPNMMQQAFEGLGMDSPRLKECSFLFFSVMARVFGEEFAIYLPAVVPPLLESCRQTEGGEKSDASASDSIVDLNSEDDAIEIDVDKLLEVNSAVAVEKEIAADTIGALFPATLSNFFPYIRDCTFELENLLTHYYEGIRKSATQSLLQIVRTSYELSAPQDWEPGLIVTVPLNPEVKELADRVLSNLLDMYDCDDNKQVVASLCAELAETINKLGFAFVEKEYERVCNIAQEVLDQKALCQRDPDQTEDEVQESQAEYDSVLVSSAGDLVSALANALGGDFIQQFNIFYPLISKYSDSSKSVSDRSAAIGCLAEIIAGMKNAITPCTEPLMDLFYKSLTCHSEAEVQSNACFAIGLLVEHSQTDLSSYYLTLLAALRPIFNTTPSSSPAQLNARDNAAGAISRMIVRNTAAVPLEQVLPVLTAALPLKNDLLENRPVFCALFHLFGVNFQSLVPYLDHLLAVFAHVLDPTAPDQIGDETRAKLIQLIPDLNKYDPVKVQASGLSVFLSGA